MAATFVLRLCALALCVEQSAAAFASSGLLQSRVSQQSRSAVAPKVNMALGLDLKGKVAFVAGVGDSSGYGWAICKALAEAGATITVGTWPPVLGIFKKSLEGGEPRCR